MSTLCRTLSIRFNPRTRMGCDHTKTYWSLSMRSVSIHAPAWGATAWSKSKIAENRCFNPRTRMGCDMFFVVVGPVDVFQSTHPHGVRRAKVLGSVSALVSIHAPAWGATRTHISSPVRTRFQSTHPHGVRPMFLFMREPTACFNPRTRMGCDGLPY